METNKNLTANDRSDETKAVQAKEIDWKQRRYEIAKELLSAFLKLQPELDDNVLVKMSIELADELIRQLKNT